MLQVVTDRAGDRWSGCICYASTRRRGDKPATHAHRVDTRDVTSWAAWGGGEGRDSLAQREGGRCSRRRHRGARVERPLDTQGAARLYAHSW